MDINIQPGDLRTPIDVYTKAKSGTTGFPTVTYTKSLSTKCQWINAHGNDAVIASADQVTKQATVTMRYHASVTEDCQIVMGGVTYEIITGIDNIRQRGQWIQFKVRAVVNA